MAKLVLAVVSFFLISSSYAQRERVHVDLDKYSCRAGDTVYIKGVILQGNHLTTLSTNLYVLLYTSADSLLSTSVFPIQYGQSIGQIIIPDSIKTGNYFLISFTRQQLNYPHEDLFSIPIIVYNREEKSSLHHQKAILKPEGATGGVINGISWTTSPYKGKVSGYKTVLSSMLEVDSTMMGRKLKVIMPLAVDSAFEDTAIFTQPGSQKYFLLPIDSTQAGQTLMLYADSTLIGRQYIKFHDESPDISLRTDTLDTSPFGYNSWNLQLSGKKSWYVAITITDADRSIPSPAPITRLKASYTDDLTISNESADRSFITYSGKATKLSGKAIKDPFSKDLMVVGVKDTNIIFTNVIHIDPTGLLKIDSMFFFGSAALQFQINKDEDGSTKDVRLLLSKYVPPPIDSTTISSNWEDDTIALNSQDTTLTQAEIRHYDLSKVKTLKATIVRHWKDPRKELDDTYTSGPPFSEPALYSYDLRNDTSDYDRDVFWYLNSQNGRLRYDPVGDTMIDALDHPIRYFIDEQEIPPYFVREYDFDRIAYIKVLESDFLSTNETQFKLEPAGESPAKPGLRIPVQKTAVNVCMYTRKGKDFRTMRGGLNKVPIKGYTPIIPFTSDKVTLYWHPMESGQSFQIRFNNSETTNKFRLKVEGVRPSGEVFYYERVLQVPPK